MSANRWLPGGLPEFVVYPDGEYMLIRPTDPLSVFRGRLSAGELAEFELLLAATGIGHDTSLPPISLGTLRPTEPTDGYFTARVGTRAVRQTVEDLWSQAEDATDERRPYEILAAWIDRLERTIPEDAWGTGDRWVAIAYSRVADFGAVDWIPYDFNPWCAVFDDAKRLLRQEGFDVWDHPSQVIVLRPALPHETDCAAVAAWDALR